MAELLMATAPIVVLWHARQQQQQQQQTLQYFPKGARSAQMAQVRKDVPVWLVAC